MRFIRRNGALLIVVLLVGCGSNSQKDQIAGNAKELLVGKWDEVKERPNQKLFSRWEYTKDGTARWWQLESTKVEPENPVNEGSYRFLDGTTFAITMKNGDLTSTDKFTIASISKDKLELVTEEKKKLVYTRAK